MDHCESTARAQKWAAGASSAYTQIVAAAREPLQLPGGEPICVCDYINVASDAATSIPRRLHSHVGRAGRGTFTPLAAPVGRQSVRPARGGEDAYHHDDRRRPEFAITSTPRL